MEVDQRKVSLLARGKFGISNFRPLQREAITAVLEGRDVFVNLRTGEGKSVIYQLPSSYWTDGIVVVISPLIALIRDQVEHLQKLKLDVAFVDSLQERGEMRRQLMLIRSGAARLLYLSPEKLASREIRELLSQVKVKLLVVDEAHCVSMWGTSFRPDYLQIAALRRQLKVPMLAVTATAPPRVRDDVLRLLGMENAVQFRGELVRPNLVFTTEHYNFFVEKLDALKSRLAAEKGSVIVYASLVRTVEAISVWAKDLGIPHVIYHGQLERSERLSAAEKFLSGEVRVVLATNAFGMGINKPDIRQVIHFDPPQSLDHYYQESGRAGRDGNPSQCTMYFSWQDKEQIAHFVQDAHPQLEFIATVYRKMFTLLPAGVRTQDRPVLGFRRWQFIEEWAGENKRFAHKITAALALLEEYQLIEREGTTVTFTRADVAREPSAPLPINPTDLDARREAAVFAMKTIEFYAYSDDDSLAELLRLHFEVNGLVDLVNNWVSARTEQQMTEDQMLPILSMVHRKAYTVGTISRYLTDDRTNDNPSEQRRALRNRLTMDTVSQVELLEGLGYLRRVSVGKRSVVILADLGVEVLKRRGQLLPAPKAWAELEGRCLDPTVRGYINEALREAGVDPDAIHERSDGLQNFLGRQFSLCDRQATGASLTRLLLAIPKRRPVGEGEAHLALKLLEEV